MSLVLVGPPGAGKSTVAAHLAPALGRDAVDADAVCAPLYAEVGWSTARLAELASTDGYEEAHRAWEVALTHAVERLVELHPTAVIALGAGHTHQTDDTLFARVRAALTVAESVVLLRPAPDLRTTVDVLRRRCIEAKGRDWIRDGVDWLERWCTDGRDEQIATHTVHNDGESPRRTTVRIGEQMRGVDRSADHR